MKRQRRWQRLRVRSLIQQHQKIQLTREIFYESSKS